MRHNIAIVLRASSVNDHHGNGPEFIPLVEFAINDSASALCTGYTPFFVNRGQHPRRPLSLPTTAPNPSSGTAVASFITNEVCALLQAHQSACKEHLDPLFPLSSCVPAGR